MLPKPLIDGEGKSLFDEINFLGLIAQHGHGDRRSVGAAAAAVALASTSGWGAAGAGLWRKIRSLAVHDAGVALIPIKDIPPATDAAEEEEGHRCFVGDKR